MNGSCKLRVISYKWLLYVSLIYNSVLLTHTCIAQTKQIDSLKQVLKIAKEDTNKVKILNEVS